MRCIIARFAFDLVKSEVEHSMKGVKPEEVTGASVTIGRRTYPVKQVGEVITRQDRRDFTADEVARALGRLGFTCHAAPDAGAGSALLGTEPVLPGPSARF
ncbi:SCO5918 family protein [Streptomyces sp. PTM05]|uniref:SCO5918 family protein n=1 Tax=Streptantibioticus parmotrematis TaxID=2873249 RepID=A0ABS7QLU0_9ACTN|nr:SCO5918 family protein [Streptantibioticus parmotrematis]MBY8884165.1 SCO5918 family protein [Streptantibioticus parmotrematis]